MLCLEISKRYHIHFSVIWTDEDHVHFLVQSAPKYGPTKIITVVKSITAKKLFKHHPEVKKDLCGGEF
jgi:REP element-mobilizing transposase RayT